MTIKVENVFKDKTAIKLWKHYFNRIERMIRWLDSSQKEEIRLELQDHLMESFRDERGDSETERLLNAIEKIGEPEDYLKPMLADRILGKAIKSMNPLKIVKGLYFYLFGGIKRFFSALLFFLGYSLAVTFALMALLKPFLPRFAGIFLYPGETIPISLGIISNHPEHAVDLFGYWVIPIGIVVSAVLYIYLTKLLRLLKHKSKTEI